MRTVPAFALGVALIFAVATANGQSQSPVKSTPTVKPVVAAPSQPGKSQAPVKMQAKRVLALSRLAETGGIAAIGKIPATQVKAKTGCANPNGVTSSSAAKTAASKTRIGHVLNAMFRAFDADKDKKVSKSEYIEGLKNRFSQIDTDKDGAVTPAELAKAHAAIAARVRHAPAATPSTRPSTTPTPIASAAASTAAAAPGRGVAAMIARYDADKNGKLSKDEFIKAGVARFARVDANNDGVITRDEVRTFVAAIRRGPPRAAESRSRPSPLPARPQPSPPRSPRRQPANQRLRREAGRSAEPARYGRQDRNPAHNCDTRSERRGGQSPDEGIAAKAESQRWRVPGLLIPGTAPRSGIGKLDPGVLSTIR